MYICEKCNKLFNKKPSRKKKKVKLLDLLYGANDDDELMCKCGGNIAEASRCRLCDKWITKESLICKGCIEKNYTLSNAFLIGRDYKEDITINGFIASYFRGYIDELEYILLKNIKEKQQKDPQIVEECVKEYCEEDLEFFKSWLEDKIGKV